MSTNDRCGSKTRSGAPCKNLAGKGTDHVGYGKCRNHGGNTPNGRKHGKSQQAVAAVVTYGLPREIDPHSALLEELHRTAGHIAWLAAKLADLESDDGLKQFAKAGTFKSESDGVDRAIIYERTSIWVDLYHRERKHFKDVAETCVRVGIEERRVHLAEEQGQLIAQVLRGVLTELGVMDRPETPAVVRRHLTMVAGGAAA